MTHKLISIDEMENLPADPIRRFLNLEATCRENLRRAISQEEHGDWEAGVRHEYMAIIHAAAEELGIGGIPTPNFKTRALEAVEEFLIKTTIVTTKLRMRAVANDPYSVQLSARNRARIRMEIDQLIQAIEESDISESKKRNAIAKLHDLLADIEQPRVQYSRIMAALVAISLVTGGTVQTIAAIPPAVAAITSLVAEDKAAEIAEQERISGPEIMKALPFFEESPDKNTQS